MVHQILCKLKEKLNLLTVKDRFPSPRIDDCLDFLARKKYLTTLDCFSGYWQCKLDDRSKPLNFYG